MQKRIRPETLEGETIKVKTGYGNLYITVTKKDNKIFEVFATVGKSGKSISAKAESVGRLVSLSLRYDIPLKEICDQLIGISGEKPTPSGKKMILSIPDAIGQTLMRFVEEK